MEERDCKKNNGKIMIELYPRKIDLYIFKKFLVWFFLSLVLIIGIVIIFDVSEKIEDFVANEAPLKEIIFNYYVNFCPYFANMFSPLFVFITVIFFTSRMAADSEIIAILSGGISYHRMMVPYFAAAGVIALLSLGLNLYVIPKANCTRIEFEAKYIKAHNDYKYKDIHYQIAPGEFVYVETFSAWNQTAYRMTLETIDEGELVSKLTAESAKWDSAYGGWHLKNYVIRDYNSSISDKVIVGEKRDTIIPLTITDFFRNDQTVEKLTYGELQDLIETQKMRGDANVIYAQIEKHTRFALPFSAFILTIIGVTLSSKKKRGGIGWNIAIGIALSFSYILFLRFSQMFVFTDTLPPGIALWLPNMIYAVIAGILYYLAPK